MAITRYYLKRLALISFAIGLCFYVFVAQAQNYSQNSKQALLLNVQDAIGPATQDYIHRGLKQAERQHAEIVILRLDTPGGLDKSTRRIVSDILASPIPVITYVGPSGARAASAGTYILYASHIAAMAPGTNLGAATPININSTKSSPNTLEIKTRNDASAYIRSLAQLRNRNEQWAEKAVLKAASLSATEALKRNVINLVAEDIPSLLTQINGDTVEIQGHKYNLNTSDIIVVPFKADWRVRLLSIITNPNIAYILMMIGLWGLFFEFAYPGHVLPGVTGIIALLLALYAFQLLPTNYAALGLILLGVAFMVAEIFLSSFGILGVGGIIAFVMGSIMLLEPNTANYVIALPLVLSLSIASTLFFLLITYMAIKTRRRIPVSGREELLNKTAMIAFIKEGQAWIRIHGELWQASSTSILTPGQKVRITDIKGIILMVEPLL